MFFFEIEQKLEHSLFLLFLTYGIFLMQYLENHFFFKKSVRYKLSVMTLFLETLSSKTYLAKFLK